MNKIIDLREDESNLKVLFMGTPDFAVPCLDKLIKSPYTLCGVVTQPDKPQGRGHKLMPPPVKRLALEYNVDVFQPDTLRNDAFKAELQSLDPDLIVVVAYGKILPEYILNYPKYGCINMHASLLPKYRGAGPIQWSVINGEKVTGVTSMLMEKGLDTGDMLLKAETEIGEYETASELHDRLMVIGSELLMQTIEGLLNGTITPQKQNDEDSCYAPMLSKETARIDWSKDARAISKFIAGMNSWPIAHTLYKDKVLKIYRATVKGTACGEVGQIVAADEDGIEIVCGDGMSIVATEVQFAGSKVMQVRDYLNGHTVEVGEILK